MSVRPPESSDDWLGLTSEPLPVDSCQEWVRQPGCGAVVLFTGTVRDVSEGRPGVVMLEYEAYEEQVEPRMRGIAAEVRRGWPDVARLVLLHRVGRLRVEETSVIVAASSPHRDTAFAAARFGIDTVKATVPIWKWETWESGSDWSLACHPVGEVQPVTHD